MALRADLSASLADFLAVSSEVWEAYQTLGPGKLESQRWEPIDAEAKRLSALLQNDEILATLRESIGTEPEPWLDQLRLAVDTLLDLTRRCATRPEGLCFITGEAGLIPRRDQHQQLEESLDLLRQRLVQLNG